MANERFYKEAAGVPGLGEPLDQELQQGPCPECGVSPGGIHDQSCSMYHGQARNRAIVDDENPAADTQPYTAIQPEHTMTITAPGPGDPDPQNPGSPVPSPTPRKIPETPPHTGATGEGGADGADTITHPGRTVLSRAVNAYRVQESLVPPN